MHQLLCSAAAVLGIATVLSAKPLIVGPSDEALATMMGSQEGVTSYLMRRFGLLTNTLMFESHFTATQFKYSVVSGSLYGTFPIEFTATGTQTSPGHWTVMGTGVVIDRGDFPDPSEFHLWDPPLLPDLSIPADHDWDGADGDWDWHGHKTWSVNPLDDGELLSGGHIVYSKKNVLINVRNLEQDSRRRFIDDTGSWQTALTGPFELAGSAKFTAKGKFAADGSGTFTVSATAIPEPAVGLLSGLIAAALAIRATIQIRRARRMHAQVLQ